MRFGIIMPTYQRPNLLKRAIESVLAQTYEDWVLVVADDGSGDDTESVIRAYANQDKRIIPSPSEENQGVNASRNRALDLLLKLLSARYLKERRLSIRLSSRGRMALDRV
jgi:glycosyltransferase involved in cell wall biosynthesis